MGKHYPPPTDEVKVLATRIFHDISKYAFNSREVCARRLHIGVEAVRTTERRLSIKIAREMIARRSVSGIS
jgi:hypothetical protein